LKSQERSFSLCCFLNRIAVEHGEADKVTSLLSKKGTCPTKLDSEGKSALHVAATRGQAECLAVILAHGADVSLQDTSGFTALHLAAKNNHSECAKKLLQTKCVVDALDSSGRTALHHAAANGDTVIVQLLCEHKCHVNLKDSDGFTPLLLSARHAHTEVCQSLLDWGADINARDSNGRTAVMLASESSCPAAVELLVQRGADLQMVDSLGHDVLHYAKLSGSSEVRTPLNTHGQKLNEDRSSTPKKRKAPPPPISPIQSAGFISPPYFTPTETPLSSKSDSSKRFNYKGEEELKSAVLKEEIEKLHEEKSMLLETIEDLKQIVEQTGPKIEHSGNADSTLIAALQAKIASLSLENQQLAQIIKKRPAPQGEEGQGSSRPNSIESNASYHSTRADFELSSDVHIHTGDEDDLSELSVLDISGSSNKYEIEEDTRLSADKEIGLLRGALENLQAKLLESRMENRTLQTRLNTDFEKAEVASKSMGEDTQKCQEALQELQMKGDSVSTQEDNVVQKFQYLKSCLEQEVKELKGKLAVSHEEQKQDACLIRDLQAQLKSGRLSEEERQELKNTYSTLVENINQEKALLIEKYKESQEEIRMLQEALRGTVPVEAAVAIADHTQVVASLGNAIKNLESEVEVLKEQLDQKTLQVDALQNRLTVKKDVIPDDSLSRMEYEQMREKLQGEISHLNHLLKDALRKQDEMALEVTATWQEVKDARNERETAQELAVSREQECSALNTKYREAHEVVVQLKKQVENHVISEREKNKKIDELSKEVMKLKDALNSLSQLSYTSTPKRQQSQQVDSLQQQIKQLQYQLAESKKRHHEVVSVYRMHLLYAVQGQMDEDVQKALKQILVMCKMPSEAK
uniref:Retinoic acid induced 14 n=1 Tax=Cyprinus carpio TaxID=7962 RepID=A0A8C2DIW3_CYPCA